MRSPDKSGRRTFSLWQSSGLRKVHSDKSELVFPPEADPPSFLADALRNNI